MPQGIVVFSVGIARKGLLKFNWYMQTLFLIPICFLQSNSESQTAAFQQKRWTHVLRDDDASNYPQSAQSDVLSSLFWENKRVCFPIVCLG